MVRLQIVHDLKLALYRCSDSIQKLQSALNLMAPDSWTNADRVREACLQLALDEARFRALVYVVTCQN